MKTNLYLLLLMASAGLLHGCSQPEEPDARLGGPSAAQEEAWRQPLFTGLGNIHFPITTATERAQQYFDQGLSLAWAFNHAAADFAFNEAALHDPDCGMCLWGSALVLGPNVNAPMDSTNAARAHALATRADVLVRANGTAKEQALTAALLERYAPDGRTPDGRTPDGRTPDGRTPDGRTPDGRSALDAAYADAMRAAAAQFPEDVHIAALTAEALMDLHPWDFWLADGEERPWTGEIIDVLERALALDENHAGAIHLYIHAVEQSKAAGRAEPYADKLADIAPAAGHLVHMPAHIYMRIGRYHDATLNNMRAANADAAFVAACRSNSPIYLAGYVPHNWHFGWVTAAISGWREQAYRMAEGTAASLTPELLRAPGMEVAQHFLVQPIFARVRFGDWDRILATAQPDADLPYARAIWHYARGRALAAGGDLEGAEAQRASLEAIRHDPAVAGMAFFGSSGRAAGVLAIAERVLSGRILAERGELEAAISALRDGVVLEDAMPYNEPPDWFYPVRHELGALQLEAGDALGAEATYRADLALMPENGWALLGLAAALRDQRRDDEAAAVQARFETAWQHADVRITSSRAQRAASIL